jgi:8-oxo-dGTP pyrophosphatase MutT (NUDIX family)
MTFGIEREGIVYTERRAAYAVVLGEGGTVAVVRGASGRLFLPGGGSTPLEAPEGTLAREVREELARSVRLIRRLGEAIQYFHARSEGRDYRMAAAFFLAEFVGEPDGRGEHELLWPPVGVARGSFFHECHAWAVEQARGVA